ncbi:hypothetical protein COW20_08800 [bacterium (Candidatus Blackallbacteria) CG13_big_fil_rev_8_21_14_2_50_49_14]|nr:MAG: hypothetical protein COW20_08800 [bacterium (Candidatus Blackallbacteria) CG13_big_fil_rev_8_21_14_2_50_49_14]
MRFIDAHLFKSCRRFEQFTLPLLEHQAPPKMQISALKPLLSDRLQRYESAGIAFKTLANSDRAANFYHLGMGKFS